MAATPVTKVQRKAHESLLRSAKQAKRIKRAGGKRAESSPEDYTVTEPEAHAVRRAIEDRAMEREIARSLKPGWEE